MADLRMSTLGLINGLMQRCRITKQPKEGSLRRSMFVYYTMLCCYRWCEFAPSIIESFVLKPQREKGNMDERNIVSSVVHPSQGISILYYVVFFVRTLKTKGELLRQSNAKNHNWKLPVWRKKKQYLPKFSCSLWKKKTVILKYKENS